MHPLFRKADGLTQAIIGAAIEVKSVERVLPIHKAQLLSYMKLLNVPVGLLINFNVHRLVDGVSRMILPDANL
jgi:GxxExxY protein